MTNAEIELIAERAKQVIVGVLKEGQRIYPDDPWKKQSLETHMSHASDHAGDAYWEANQDGLPIFGPPSVFREPGEVHLAHCLARMALGLRVLEAHKNGETL